VEGGGKNAARALTGRRGSDKLMLPMPPDKPSPTPESSLAALVNLLADDHVEVVEAARAKLVELGEKAISFLENSSASHEDPKVRVEAKGVLEMIRLVGVSRTWEAAMLPMTVEPDLESSAFLMAKVCYPDLDPKPYQKRLDVLAERIRPRLKESAGMVEKLTAMNRVLFQDERFRGNWNDYFDPQNSYLNRVLDRKLGIPISLCVLYLLIARRLELKIDGVGIPGHFMLKCKEGDKEFYIDPFNEGRFLKRAECIQFVVEAGYPYQAEFLEGVGVREILARMLRNLILIYLDRHEPTLEKTLTRLLDLMYEERDEEKEGGLNYE